MNSPIATLPLYDLPEARIQTDALWKGLADSFRKFGLNSEPDSKPFKVPDALFRADNCYAETVFFAQICGYPLTHEFAGRFQLIATPVYKTPFFSGAEYRSAIVVHQQCEWETLAQAEGSRAVINSKNSHSGFNILRFMVTQLTGVAHAEEKLNKAFFRKVLISGGHRESLLRISQKQADVAAIDCLTWSMLERYAPENLQACRILELSPPAPAPAFVTERDTSPAKLELFRKALQFACNDPVLKSVREQLFLENVEVLEDNSYNSILKMEKESIEDL